MREKGGKVCGEKAKDTHTQHTHTEEREDEEDEEAYNNNNTNYICPSHLGLARWHERKREREQ